MALRRFYISDREIDDAGTITIRGDLFHHMRDVCRFGPGDRFEALPGDQRAILMEIDQISGKEIRARAIETRTLPALAKPWITLALSIPKLPKVDWIVEKCVELGVYEIRPFVSDYSFLRKTSDISPSRMNRWEKLIKSATQQSGRGDLMKIHPVVTLNQLLDEFNRKPGVKGLFPYEGEAERALPDAVREIKKDNPESIWVFVGSEGGFSPREVKLFAEYGLPPVSMGSQVLRVETACLALVSVIKYETGTLC